MSDATEKPPGDEPAALKPDEPAVVSSPQAPAGSQPDTATPDAGTPGAAAAQPAPPAPPVEPPPAWSPPPAPAGADGDGGPAAAAASAVADRPEIAVGAAFAGGLVLALILKRLAR